MLAVSEGRPKRAVLETLRSMFGHLTVNGKPRFAVRGITLPVCPYLGLKIRGWHLLVVMFVLLQSFTSILSEKSSLK